MENNPITLYIFLQNQNKLLHLYYKIISISLKEI